MNCAQVQQNLSLYLYGELDFANEEAVEVHLGECAFCQQRLQREKLWHTGANSILAEPPLDLLAECRQQLRPAMAREKLAPPPKVSWWRRLDLRMDRWSLRLAAASMLLFAGFSAGRWIGVAPSTDGSQNYAGLVSEIRPAENGRVRLVLAQPHEVVGRLDDRNIHRLLLEAMRQPDPSVRFASMDLLTRQDSGDLRDLLTQCVRTDPNAAVRLKAIEGLRRYTADTSILDAVRFTIENDENPSVRFSALELLAPPGSQLAPTQETVQVLQEVVHSPQGDEYVRSRCIQVLRQAKQPVEY